jgi:hypothetical protein
MLKYSIAILLALVVPLAPLYAQGDTPMAADGAVLFSDDFSEGMDNWWREGGLNAWVEDGKLYLDAEPGGERGERRDGLCATMWCKQKFEDDIKIELDTQVIRSDIDVNNINFFIHFSDTSGTPIYETREDRPQGAYQKYHVMNGNIITFLSDTREEAMALPPDERLARIRLRHCPGFELIKEEFTYQCHQRKTYHIEIVHQGGNIRFSVDGKLLTEVHDPEAPTGGLFGLRTFRTLLWYDNIKISRL